MTQVQLMVAFVSMASCSTCPLTDAQSSVLVVGPCSQRAARLHHSHHVTDVSPIGQNTCTF
ncbi:hypothetical protein PF005_g10197 [Phytophthora fragariae]|uniref:RxLR effector protein n=1 Tax=Phytophthora fragariae TaxID=53985 RepID=A0A6A3U4S7_9STRA|nr:hypothetical protein PF003_g33725 [Phytophthora fragariae]KAE8938754.1 hypothetical protein PF009_g11380 [Phytophthora fragariae]KAE9012603.1 hypothetical protein PF011_g8847 [Phytophthora fragariae]KAE9119750.1 hypothetical protein PF010_g7743 [Phytophthora fragariae]KAE9125874.1 hypothetical protein PF007_g6201 [Phytophthora fragariae]